MPDRQPESQEEILAACEASLTEADIPPEDEAFGWPDPDCGMPAELLALCDVELEELLEAAPVRPAPLAWPLSYQTSGGSAGFAPGDGSGSGTGFAQGEVLDVLPASMALAGFADSAHARVASLDDDSQIGVLRAWRRLTSWAQARELAMVAELARRRPAPGFPPAAHGQFPAQLSEFVADEVGLALTLTGMAAQGEMDLALDLASRPAIAAALETGRIDLPRARILLSVICPLEPAHADAVESAVLPRAGDLTTGQLRAALQRAVLAVDPDAARRRREEAQKGARVEHWADPEGTATLAGRYLPPAEVLAADKRLCAIATAWKKLGGQGGMDLLRAHVYLALLLGQPIDTPPPGLLLPRAGAPAPASHGPGPDGNGSLCPLTTPGPSQHGAGTPGHGDGPAPAGLRRPGASTGGLPPMTGTVNLTVPLTTLLGLADQPGEAAGHGPLHADTIRTLTHAMTGHPGTRWGLIITSATGRAMGYGGSVPARPTSAGGWKITITTEPIAPYP